MAKNYEEFRVYGKQMVDYICDYVKTIEEKPVAPAIDPGYLAPLLPDKIPEKSEEFSKVMEDFESKIMPGVLHWNHPNFFAYFGAGNGYPSLLGDMLSSGISSIGFSWASCPALTELEFIVLDWYAKALDLPEFFLSKRSNEQSVGGGALQASASDAIFSCMCAALARAIRNLKGTDHEIHDSNYLPRLVCYSSTEAHSSIEKAAKMNFVQLHVVEPDSHDCLRGAALEEAVATDVANGLTPFFVVGTVGTTSQVAFDNLVEIGQVCQKYPSMWFHVDGAYGGNSFVVPEMRKFKEGIEFADSFEVNPNKLMLTTFDSTCLWVKDILCFTAAFAVDPLYLQHQHDSSVVDLRHFGTPLSRRFRSLKLYFMFRMYGLEEMQKFIRRVLAVGQHFEKLVRADKRFEVRNDVHLGLVCFRLLQTDFVNQEFLARMNGSGKIYLTPANVRGKYIIRFVANQENCNQVQVEKAWKLIQEFATEIITDLVAPSERRRPSIRKLDNEHSHRFSFTRSVSKDIFMRQPSIQRLTDGATPIVVIDSEDILKNLQIASCLTEEDEESQLDE